MAFEAKFPGECASCGGDIKPKQKVTYEDDQLRHAVCEDEIVSLVAAPVCSDCHMEIAASGDCGCY